MELSTISQYLHKHFADIVFVIPVAIIGFIFARLLRKGLINRLPMKNDETIKLFLGNILYVSILIIVTIIILSKLGFPTTTLITIIGASGLTIGLALQSTLSNVAAGIMLVITRPFHVGDLIDLGSSSGTVEQINIFNTQLKTANNEIITVPNGKLIADKITNRTARPVRRINHSICVSRQVDFQNVKQMISDELENIEGILQKPQTSIVIRELSNSALTLSVRAWVKRSDYGHLDAQILEQIQVRLQKEKVQLPDF